MRKRKDIASLIRNIERPSNRKTYMGNISSVSGNGKTINGQNFSDSEVRNLLIALPYGISSSGLDGLKIQIITNDNQNNVAVGVIDPNRPPIRSGCLAIYDKSGIRIMLNGDGSIILSGDIKIEGSATLNGKSIKVDE